MLKQNHRLIRGISRFTIRMLFCCSADCPLLLARMMVETYWMAVARTGTSSSPMTPHSH